MLKDTKFIPPDEDPQKRGHLSGCDTGQPAEVSQRSSQPHIPPSVPREAQQGHCGKEELGRKRTV